MNRRKWKKVLNQKEFIIFKFISNRNLEKVPKRLAKMPMSEVKKIVKNLEKRGIIKKRGI